MRRLAVFWTLPVVALWLAAPQPNPEIVHPPNGVLITRARLCIVARADDVQTPVRVVRKVRENGVVHLVVQLRMGENRIPLVLVQGGRVRRVTRTVHYFPSTHYQMAPAYRFHESFKGVERCMTCHTRTEGDDSRSCLSCHPDKNGEVDVPHEGFDPEDCSLCHEENGGMAPPDVCMDCHDPVAGQQHAPYAVGDCQICHDPHGGTREHLLTDTIRALCTRCHPAADYREFVHPIRKHPHESQGLTCVTCHHPHGGPFAAYLQKAPEVICGTCHEEP